MPEKLELRWPGKDDGFALVRDERTGDPMKIPYGEVQPRVLIEQARYGDADAENMLIRGENLFALKSLLAAGFAGKIKLIYIDPPFNTGQTFEHYDDGLEMSLYLSMMRDRLVLMRELLTEDGSIYVHLDTNANAHVRLLMDEVFGRSLFTNELIWRRTAAHNDPGRYGNIHDILLFYTKTGEYTWNPQFMSHSEESVAASFCYAEGPKGEIVRIKNGQQPPAGHRRFQTVTLRSPHPRPNLYYVYKGYKPHPNGWSCNRERMEQYDREGRLFYPSSKDGAVRLKMYLDESPGVPVQDLWTDVKKLEASSLERAGFDTQKPEALLDRIIKASSNAGDWVLDCFAGSGTTGAVAQKLGRKWIMVELGEQAQTFALPRLKKLVAGEGQGVLADNGGFRYYVLGEPLVITDKKLGVPIINPKYDNGLLVQAVLLQEGFTQTGDSELHGRNGSAYAHVTEEYVTPTYLKRLTSRLSEGEALVIYCLKYAPGLQSPKNVKVKKIPRDLKVRYANSQGKSSANEAAKP